jgi:hypothetical protein
MKLIVSNLILFELFCVMAYKITTYTKNKAKYLGVSVRPSRTKGKKIDVLKNGIKVAAVGALGYADYPTFMQMENAGLIPKGTAKRRRLAYKSRHAKDRKVVGSAGYYADQLLW